MTVSPSPRFRGPRSILWRVLAVNLLPLAILVGGLLYLDRHKQNLIRSQLDSLIVQGGIFAAALGEAAVTTNPVDGVDTLTVLARPMVRRLAVPASLHARLFASNGDLIADSRVLGSLPGRVEVLELPPPSRRGVIAAGFAALSDFVWRLVPSRASHDPWHDPVEPRAEAFAEALEALDGEIGEQVRITGDGRLILSVAIPVQRYRQVLGALMLSVDDTAIRASLRSLRLEILTISSLVLVVTILLSLWLAGTIARPLRRLAGAAERVRLGHGPGRDWAATIPDLKSRGDEIGDLSESLRAMTSALWSRMEAIERFGADVAHEIKNPLTSLRSAVETAARIDNPEQQKRLMAIILDDVGRLNRLITDISDASRLDAELGRAEMERVDLAALLSALVETETVAFENRAQQPGAAPGPHLVLSLDSRPLVVLGIGDRLVQVFRNLIANAASFSPPGGEIRILARRRGASLRILVEDQGPGLPPGKLEAIFERFYSERPEGEKFGTHSGLGLSISRQIVIAHHGRIRAENIRKEGRIAGARFIVTLPAAEAGGR